MTYLFLDGWTMTDAGTNTTARKNAREILSKETANNIKDWNINISAFNNLQSNSNRLSSDVRLQM